MSTVDWNNSAPLLLAPLLSPPSPELFIFAAILKCGLHACIQAWRPHYRKDIDKLEKVQRRATRMVEGLGSIVKRIGRGSWGSLL